MGKTFSGFRLSLFGVLLFSITILAACSNPGSATTTQARNLRSISLSPHSPDLNVGQTTQFTATGTYSDSSTQDVTASVAWASSNTAAATIVNGGAQSGLATGVAAGTATIQAVLSGVTGSTTLTVNSATLVSIAITPADASVPAGHTLQFKATGTYSDNSTQDVTASVAWASSNTAAATIVNGGAQSGLATGVAAGTATIQAALSGVTGSTTLTVNSLSASLVSIAVTPADASVPAGQTLQFKATGTYSDSSTQDVTASVAWASSNTAAATIVSGGAQSGLATGVAAGTTTIQAVLSGVTGSTTLTVNSATLVSIAVTPANPSLPAGQTLQFKATGTYSDNSTQDVTASVAWASSNTAAATIVSGGTQPGLATGVAAGTATIQAVLSGVTGSTALTVSAFEGVLTYHNDLARTGQNLDETVLTPANVGVNSFGKLFSVPVDGYVYAQPLYVPDVTIAGLGVHNVVYVATENDTLYAFDADAAGPPLWQVSLLGPGETPVSSADVSCTDLVPEIGITSTPVIDPATKTIYVVARSKLVSGSSTTYYQRLYAIDITTGKERPGSPAVISGTVQGTAFDPLMQFNRAGLALVGGDVYIGFGSLCDNTPFHGWLFSYDAAMLAQVSVFDTTPTGSEGAIWQGGGAPAADASGNIYIVTGNGDFDADTGGADYGDSLLKFSQSGNTLAVTDYFTPADQSFLSASDLDLGSADLLLLPDSAGSSAHPHLIVVAGKGGSIYLVDRDDLGKFCSGCSSDTQIVQELSPFHYNHISPVFWHGTLYLAPTYEGIYAYSIANGLLSSSPVSQTSAVFGGPGPGLSISADGSTNGILWVLDSSQYSISGPADLRAYLASNLTDELYSSNQAPGGRDTAGGGVKFAVPTIANGKVYIGTETELDVYGLLP